jgi:hypothetical protein
MQIAPQAAMPDMWQRRQNVRTNRRLDDHDAVRLMSGWLLRKFAGRIKVINGTERSGLELRLDN